MTRGRGFSSSYRGSSMRSSWGGSGDRGRGSYGSSSRGRFSSSFSNSIESRSKYPTTTDRYSTSTRGYDDYKTYRGDISSGGYTGRDSQRSPERKRLRPEAPSSRRSHEGDGFNSSSSRYQSNSFSEHRSFSRDRRPPSYTAARDDFRRPPRSLATSTPRGGYRGRISSRGLRGARDVPPRRRMVDTSYAIRKRLMPRLSSDYTRRLKITRLRSAITRRPIMRKRDLSDKEDSEEEEEDKDKESDSEMVEEKKKDNKGDDNEDKEQKEGDSESKEGTQKNAKKEIEKEDSDTEKPHRKEFIKLVCPHCNVKCLTFSKYSVHLHNNRHVTAMRHVAMKQKSVLARMRLSQRNAQRELEKSTDDLAPRTNFCPLCKLNYKQPKATHQASDSHKNMKKFLMPYCRVCRITFKSPMLYETHICSIEHIKRKARNEVNGDKSDKEEISANEDDTLENFMTIDSVGDVDDEDDDKKKDPEIKPKEKINVGIEQIRKVEVNYCELCHMYLPRVDDNDLEKTLAKHCKQRTHLQRYIRYKEDKEIASRAERLQRKETAEKEREKNKLKDQKNEGDGAKDLKVDEKEKHSGDDDEAIDDKLWADDVNKDLGDILAEAESGNKTSDEDDDSHVDGQRYDSEKNGEEKKKENDAATDEAVADEKKPEEAKEEAK
ncbi:hypothetical protein FQR65_LT08255 [Abscondita terminalis]|nr:hypothetical protein FQR65_LT08255 [Abscondita terminalis]